MKAFLIQIFTDKYKKFGSVVSFNSVVTSIVNHSSESNIKA